MRNQMSKGEQDSHINGDCTGVSSSIADQLYENNSDDSDSHKVAAEDQVGRETTRLRFDDARVRQTKLVLAKKVRNRSARTSSSKSNGELTEHDNVRRYVSSAEVVAPVTRLKPASDHRSTSTTTTTTELRRSRRLNSTDKASSSSSLPNGESHLAPSGLKLTIRVQRPNLNCDSKTIIDRNNNLNALPSETCLEARHPTPSAPNGIDEASSVSSSSSSSRRPDSSSTPLIFYKNQICPPKNGTLPESKYLATATTSASPIISPVHKYKKKKKKKKSKHRLNENIEKQLGQAKRLRLIFGNSRCDSISINIKDKLNL